MVAFGEEGAAAASCAIDGSCDATPECSQCTRQLVSIECFDDEMEVILLDAVVGEAKVFALVLRGKYGAYGSENTVVTEAADVSVDAPGDVHGIVARVSRPRSVWYGFE